MTEKAKREPNYFDDIKKYGEFGENIFLEKFSQKMNIIDVRKNESYQKDDIDFLIARENERYISIDVKVDTVGLKTGNLAYEVISHGCNGWSVITKADYIFFVMAEEKNTELKPIVSYWIDMPKWKEYCSNRKTKKKLNMIKNEEIVDLLCPISELKRFGIIRKQISL